MEAVRAQENIADLQIGDAAPDFNLSGIDGKTYSLEDFADGKVLMVFFTSNHCPTSHGVEERLFAFLDEMNENDLSLLVSAARRFNGRNFDFINISVDHTDQKR